MSFLQKEITLPKLRAPRRGRPSPEAPEPTPTPEARKRTRSHRPRRPSGGLRAPARRAAGVTGLEIGATQAIAAQAHAVDGRITAERVAVRALPDGLVRDGLVLDAPALATELRALFAGDRLSKRVRVGLATPRTILRVIDLPPLDERDIRAALLLHAQDRIPMPLDRAVLDHQTIGIVDTPEGRRLRVMVVATEREGVETLLDALGRAGLRAEGIDLSVFAAIRAVGGAAPPAGPVLYAQLGDLVNFAIADGGLCHFTRQAPQGLAMVLERLTETCGGSLAEARRALSAGDGSEVGGVLHRVARELGSELRAAAEFYGNQFGAAVTTGIVTGPLAPLAGFAPALADASGLQLRCGEVATASADALGGLDARVAPVAAGLAVGEVRA